MTPAGSGTTIRPYAPSDAADLYDVCLRTGADGADARAEYDDPRLLGDVYVGPYLEFEPGLAFVLDDGGRARGYVLGAMDTATFEDACARSWWPAMQRAHPRGDPRARADAEIVAHMHDPPTADPAVLRDYPSHLHIDLLPQWQGTGWGRRLIDTLVAALAAAGSPGVHLVVSATNARAIGFYRRIGFADLDGGHATGSDDADPGGRTVGLRLRAHSG